MDTMTPSTALTIRNTPLPNLRYNGQTIRRVQHAGTEFFILCDVLQAMGYTSTGGKHSTLYRKANPALLKRLNINGSGRQLVCGTVEAVQQIAERRTREEAQEFRRWFADRDAPQEVLAITDASTGDLGDAQEAIQAAIQSHEQALETLRHLSITLDKALQQRLAPLTRIKIEAA